MGPLRAIALPVFLLAALPGCTSRAEPVLVPLRVVTAPDDEPLDFATELLVEVEEGGAPVAEQRYPVDLGQATLPPLPFGEELVLRVEALADELVLAKGRTFPFAVRAGGSPPRADVFVGSLGRFVTPTPEALTGEVELVSPTSFGAWLVTRDGAIWRYLAHDELLDGDASVTLQERQASLAGAGWVPLGGGLLAVGGQSGGASFVGEDGQIGVTLSARELPGQQVGVALAATPDGAAAVVVGGAPEEAAEPVTAVSLVTLEAPLSLGVRSLPPLPVGLRDARAEIIEVAGDESCPCQFVIVVGGVDGQGRGVDAAVAIDLEGRFPVLELALDGAWGAATTAMRAAPQEVLVVGGLGDDGRPIAGVRRLLLHYQRQQWRLDVDAPLPPPLYFERAFAEVLRIGEGLAVILGGEDLDGAPLATAELFEINERLPAGDITPTGSLPSPFGSPRAALLGDGTVLVVDRAGLALYVPPRGR